MSNKDPDDLAKWAFLAQAPYRDAKHPRIEKIAAGLDLAANGDARCYAHLAHALARDCIRYVSDTQRTGGEDIAGYTREPGELDAVEALDRGRDDCDAKARLFVALCLARGLTARMRPLWRRSADGDKLQHVSAEVLLGGRWQPVETTLARARLGEEPERVPKEAHTGQWLRG